MKLLDRYVFWSFVRNYLISFMVLVGLYVVMDMVLNFHDLVDVKGQTAGNQDSTIVDTVARIADYYFYRIFLIFVYLSGIIPVVAAAFTLMRLSRFNELTAVLAAGVHMLRIAMPVIIGGVIANALLIADQELIIPRIIPQLMRDHDESAAADAKSYPIMALQDRNNALIRATRYTPAVGNSPPTMEIVDIIEREEVTRKERRSDGTEIDRKVIIPIAKISADKAIWDPADQSWKLINGQRARGLGADPAEIFTDGQPNPAPHAVYKSNVTPEEIALYRNSEWVEMLSTGKIEELIARPGAYGQAHLLRVKHWRFTQPIMNVILLLLAIPCVLTREPNKLKAAATKCLILTGLGMGAIFLSHQLAARPLRPEWAAMWPAFAAWAPVFLFGPIAVLLLDRVKT